MRLGVADQQHNVLFGELLDAIEAAGARLGIELQRMSDPAREAEYDLLLMVGYPYLYPAFHEHARRTRRVLWFAEHLSGSPPGLTSRALRALPSARILDVAHDTVGRVTGSRARGTILRWRERAALERIWGANVTHLRRAHSVVDELVVTSRDVVHAARLAGWTSARHVPFGYHEAMAGALVPADSAGRDIDVLVLARDVDARIRRARVLRDFYAQLPDAVSVEVVDRGLYGADRHRLLARARVVLDIHRLPGNIGGIRFVLASAAGAAVVTEGSPDEPMAGSPAALVRAPTTDLADAVVALLRDEDRRRALVAAAQDQLSGEMSMEASLMRLIDGGGASAD